MKSLNCVGLTLKLPISNNVNIKSSMLTPNFKALMLIETKIRTPNGTPTILPNINLFNNIKSMSFRIFKINDIEITKDKVIFICMASCGWNNISKKGVAIMEKPKPVLDCSIEATNTMHMKISAVPKVQTPIL